ncbi:MAG: hypothetical protein QN174_07645 [Armatimonadota bacterium]|nr:hypothetical protein [Armatimonadota bacterium]
MTASAWRALCAPWLTRRQAVAVLVAVEILVVGPTVAGWQYRRGLSLEERCEIEYEAWEARHPGATLQVVADGSPCGRLEAASAADVARRGGAP